MKILHTADWHLGTFRSPVKDGVNLRTEDTKRCLNEMIRVAGEDRTIHWYLEIYSIPERHGRTDAVRKLSQQPIISKSSRQYLSRWLLCEAPRTMME